MLWAPCYGRPSVRILLQEFVRSADGPEVPINEVSARSALLNNLNYEYNEVEELRTEPREHYNRHFELFRERSRFTGWLFTLVLGAAFVILFKVLIPFQDLSEQRIARSNELTALNNRQSELSMQQAELRRVAEHFSLVQGEIQKAPWRRTPQKLVATIRQLNRAYRVLLEATDSELNRQIEERQTTQQVGFASDASWALPASFRVTNSQAAKINWNQSNPPQTEHAQNGLATSGLNGDQMAALHAYFEAADNLREMGLLDESQLLRASVMDQAPDDSDHEPAWMSLPPPSLAESVHALHVTPKQILELQTFRERDELLFKVLESRAQEEAHKLLDEVYDSVSESIVSPLRKTLDHLEGSNLVHLKEGFEELESSVDQWRDQHKSNSSWYHTASAKGQAVDDLGVSIGMVLAKTANTLKAQSAEIRREQVLTKDRLQEVARERESLNVARTTITAKLDGIMPSWFKGLIEARELIQVFPLILILLLLVLGYNAWLVRDHYLSSRIPGEDLPPYTSASLWTLVRRGKFRTLSTLAIMLGGTGLLWYAYEQGVILMTRWAALDGSQAWAFTGSISEAAPWIGRTIFLVAASGIVLALLWREPLEEDPEEDLAVLRAGC